MVSATVEEAGAGSAAGGPRSGQRMNRARTTAKAKAASRWDQLFTGWGGGFVISAILATIRLPRP